MFKKNNATKKGKLNITRHKATRITDGIYQNNNKLFVNFNTKPPCKLEFSDHL